MSIFGKILKTTFDVITTPIAVVKDVATFGENDYTKDKLSDIGEDLDEIRDEFDKL